MKTLTLLFPFAFLLLILSCQKSDPLQLTAGKVERSECKSNLKSAETDVTPDTLSCINYSFNSSTKVLSITHINAGFNCCPGDIECFPSLNGDTIIILEKESTSMCDCDCLFDISYEISNVENTINYIRIVEPYSSNDDPIIIKVSLRKENNGSLCSTRNYYPWGMF